MISVLVVDDSVVVRRLIVDALGADPSIQVVGTAANGRLAQSKIDQLRPDVVTMDIEMPEMDGITAVRELRKRHPRLPVIMFSTLSAAGAAATLDALAAGATDYVTKPSNTGSMAASVVAVRDQLLPRIHQLGGRRPLAAGAAGAIGRPPRTPARPPGSASSGASRPPARPSALPAHRVDVVAVGSSTGGPDALARVFRSLPTDLPVPVVVTQHMPPIFTRMFAERLDRATPITVVEAEAGMALRPGTAYIAPGDRHLLLQREGNTVTTRLSDAPPENSCRPAVDVMFRSVADTFGPAALGVVLTGMGHDGRDGSRGLRAVGSAVIAQDEASSVVWGMPGAVVGADLADAVLPLDDIASAVMTRVATGRVARKNVVVP